MPGQGREMEPGGKQIELTVQAVGGTGLRPAGPPKEARPTARAGKPPAPVAGVAPARREGPYDWMIELEAQNAASDDGEAQCD
jgi:hypothetical protein